MSLGARVLLDGTYHEDGAQLVWQQLGHLKTREVGDVLERTVRRIDKHLRRRDGLQLGYTDESVEPEDKLAASAVSGQAPPAGPQWLRGLSPLDRAAPKRVYADGTVAVEMDPLLLLCRLATSVPPPRFHTVKYAGVLARRARGARASRRRS